jgi:hypothetical protein
MHHRQNNLKLNCNLTGYDTMNRVSSVGIVTDWMAGVRFQAGAKCFSLLHSAQTNSVAHPASYPMGAVGSFTGGKTAGT